MRLPARRMAGLALALALVAVRAGADGETGLLDPSARVPEDGSASEMWDLVAVLESGHRVVSRFLITHLGPGRRNGAVIGYLLGPDGRSVEFRNGRRRSGWELEAEGRSLRMGHSHLEVGAADGSDPGHFRLDITKDKVNVDLPFRARSQARIPAKALADGYHSQLLALAAPTRARLWAPGWEEPVVSQGRVTLTHTWTDRAESDAVVRRIELVGLDGPTGLYVSEITTPDGRRRAWARASDLTSGQGHSTTLSEPLAHVGHRELAQRGEGYWIPEAVQLPGGAAEGGADVGRVLLEVDPLGVLPPPFRWIVAWTMRPHRVWAEADFHVTLRAGQSPLVASGAGVMVVTFTNPVDRPRAKSEPSTEKTSARSEGGSASESEPR